MWYLLKNALTPRKRLRDNTKADSVKQVAEIRSHRKQQTEMSEADASLNPPHVDLPSPGSLLRTARERTQYTTPEIAAHLRLNNLVIEALEADRYEALPAPAFVRGYLRGYANLLQLPVKPIIEAYNRRNFSSPNITSNVAPSPSDLNRIPELPNRLFLYALIAVALIGLVIWQVQQSFVEVMVDTETANQSETVHNEGDPDIGQGWRQWLKNSQYSLASLINNDAGTNDTVSDSVSISGATNAFSQSLDAAGGATTVAAIIEAMPQAELTTAVVTNASSSAHQILALQTAATVVDTATTSASLSAASLPAVPTIKSPETIKLTLGFSADAWVEIHAGDEKKRLAYRLAKSGTRLELQGQAPIDVLIGAPGKVKFWIDQQQLSLIEYAPSGVARFHILANKQIVAGSLVTPLPIVTEGASTSPAITPPPVYGQESFYNG